MAARQAFHMDTRVLQHHGVPHSVLTGTDTRYRPVYNLFVARMTQEWLRHLNVSYWTRALGQFDPVAGHWTKLKKSTIQAKQELEADGQHTSFTHEGQLMPTIGVGTGIVLPSDQEIYKKSYTEKLESDKSTASIATKRARARKAALGERNDRSFARLINIRTGRLVTATAPGTVVGNRYYATKDQDVRFTKTAIRVSLRKVEYAGEVDAQREIIPVNTTVWYIESWNTVLPEVARLYEELKKTVPEPVKNSRGRLRKPQPKKPKKYLEDAPF